METSNLTLISRRRKVSLLIAGSFLFAFALAILVLPNSAANSQTEPDYNLLIQESKDNSATWENLEVRQNELNTRNDEIRAIICQTGVCAFQ